MDLFETGVDLFSPIATEIELPPVLMSAIDRALVRHPTGSQDDIIKNALAVFLEIDEVAHELT